MIRLVCAALLCFAPFASSAQQGCFGTGQPLLHCTLKDGSKALNICLQGDVSYYHYGPVGGPAELILARHVRDVFMLPWAGVSSSIYEEIEFQSGDITYQVFAATDRIAADQPDQRAGIRVFRADQTLANLSCDTGSVVQGDFYPLFEAKERAGECYTRETFSWGPC